MTPFLELRGGDGAPLGVPAIESGPDPQNAPGQPDDHRRRRLRRFRYNRYLRDLLTVRQRLTLLA